MRRAAIYSLAFLLAVLLWQAAVVHSRFASNWTGLFYIGDRFASPPEISGHAFVHRNSDGYDAQMYRVMAHDPAMTRWQGRFVDDAKMRYRRILLPALAWVFGLGNDAWIDAAYIALNLVFLALGVFWSCGICARMGVPQICGLLFALIPSTPVSVDRLVLDGVAGALTAGVVYYWLAQSPAGVWAMLAASALTRETGVLIAAPCVLFALYRRQIRHAAIYATSVIPAVLWYAFLHFNATSRYGASGVPGWVRLNFDPGIFAVLFNPQRYPFSPTVEALARGLDVLALLGMLLCFALAAAGLRALRVSWIAWCLAPQLALFWLVNTSGFWLPIYGYSRVFGPLFVLLFAFAVERRDIRWFAGLLLSVLMVDARIFFEWIPLALSILR